MTATALAASLEACRQYAVELLADAERAIARRDRDAIRAARRGLRRAIARLAQIAGQAPALVAIADPGIAHQLGDADRIAAAYERLAADLPWPSSAVVPSASAPATSQTLPTRILDEISTHG